jgi:SAM-dependent methyltransferase
MPTSFADAAALGTVAAFTFVAAHLAIGALALFGVRWAIRAHRRPVPLEGATIRWATLYDGLVAALSFGREGAFRQRILACATLQPGEHVLDVGCGTGTLALAAKRVVGASGRVEGVDFSEAMITRATRKAAAQQLDVRFAHAPAQRLPVAAASIDVVFATLVLHHLPREARADAIQEIRRVLRPGGRVCIVDLGPPTGLWALLDPIALVHGRQGQSTTEEAAVLLRDAGFLRVLHEPLGARALAIASAIAP